jgi:hypothetical protein
VEFSSQKMTISRKSLCAGSEGRRARDFVKLKSVRASEPPRGKAESAESAESVENTG